MWGGNVTGEASHIEDDDNFKRNADRLTYTQQKPIRIPERVGRLQLKPSK